MGNNACRSVFTPKRSPLRPLGIVAWATLAMAASGCSNLYLHSPVRQQQAEAATKAWGEVDNAVLFTAERENLAKLAEAEQLAQVHVAAAIRENLATVIANPGAGDPNKETAPARQARSVRSTVLSKSREAFEQLVGTKDAYEARIKIDDMRKPLQREIEIVLAHLAEIDSPPVGCSEPGEPTVAPEAIQAWLSSLHKDARIGANDDLRNLEKQCEELRALPNPEPKSGAEEIRALQKLNNDKRDLLKLRSQFSLAKVGYDLALKAYAVAVAAAAPADVTLSASVAAKAADVMQAITVLRGLQNVLAQEFVANQTIDSIDSALSAIVAGKVADDAKKEVVFAVQAPALIDRYRAAMAEAKKPLVWPLLIRRNAEQIQRDAAAADIKLMESKIAVSVRIVEAVRAEADALRRAQIELEAADGLRPGLLDQPWAEALESGTGRPKQLLLSGTARYLDAVSRLEGERFRLQYTRIAFDHERGLAHAQASAAQWANLIGAGVGQMESFAKGGINDAVISDFAKVLGLFWVGHGVNK